MFVADSVLDAALDKVKTADGGTLNTSTPANRAAAISDNLINTEWTPTFSANQDGTGGGRSVNVLAVSNQTADAGGTATNVSLIDPTELIYSTTCDPTAVADQDVVNMSLWTIRIADPVAV